MHGDCLSLQSRAQDALHLRLAYRMDRLATCSASLQFHAPHCHHTYKTWQLHVVKSGNTSCMHAFMLPGLNVTQRLNGRNVRFITGTDEHGEKIATAAASNNMSPQQHCDKIVGEYESLWGEVSRAAKAVSCFVADNSGGCWFAGRAFENGECAATD